MMARSPGKRFGFIGGLGALTGADLFTKLLEAALAGRDKEHLDVIVEQRPRDDCDDAVADERFNPTARKLYVFDTIKGFEQRNVDAVILNCFISHTFIDELTPEIKVPVVNMLTGLRAHIERKYPGATRLGVLTSNYVKARKLFERTFDARPYALIYPVTAVQNDCLMEAIYGSVGIKTGQLQGKSIELIQTAYQDLVDQGAEVVIPGLTEISMVLDQLQWIYDVPIIDSNRVYAEYAIDYQADAVSSACKIGIIGGVGPSATVDFMDKVIRHTKAERDQEHIKMVVEHNPQIPDRTEHLVAGGIDPTIALYAACKKLEAADADMIAIPCNTAHAFVEQIQRQLSIPIINMLFETTQYIAQHYSGRKILGLLATTGTVTSRVYHELIETLGLQLIVPDERHQAQVMNAIYGEKGVKAGYVGGECKMELMQAIEHLVGRGAEVLILGCTELPLLVAQTVDFAVGEKRVSVLDPTEILARRCIELARHKVV